MSSRKNAATSIDTSLRAISIGSFLFQSSLAADLGLHPTDLQAIHLLGGTSGRSAGELAESLGLTTGSTTALIDRIERLGYVKRTRDENDRRKVVVTLNPPKIADLRQRYRFIDQRIAALLKERSDEQLIVIAEFLEAVARSSK